MLSSSKYLSSGVLDVLFSSVLTASGGGVSAIEFKDNIE